METWSVQMALSVILGMREKGMKILKAAEMMNELTCTSTTSLTMYAHYTFFWLSHSLGRPLQISDLQLQTSTTWALFNVLASSSLPQKELILPISWCVCRELLHQHHGILSSLVRPMPCLVIMEPSSLKLNPTQGISSLLLKSTRRNVLQSWEKVVSFVYKITHPQVSFRPLLHWDWHGISQTVKTSI